MNRSVLPSEPFFPESELQSLRRRIRAWFAGCGRDLPWRRTRDPYAVWVSEIMLQQTTTETVTGYFGRFLNRFPTVEALARADISEVLRYWEGLGYYRRAHLLHKAAGVILKEYAGRFPARREEIETLPGFGRYTTGAVLSFAFGRREPILEANTSRLHARLLALRGDLARAENSRILWDFARRILPARDCGAFNQALIDLGRLVCRPKGPRCGECPCASFCRAARNGSQNEIPSPKEKPRIEERTEVAWLVHRTFFMPRAKDAFLFIRYPEHLRWGGLWDFPRFLREGEGAAAETRLAESLAALAGSARIRSGAEIFRMTHAVTRYRIRLVLRETAGRAAPGEPSYFHPESPDLDLGGRIIPFAGGAARLDGVEYRWLTLRQASDIPLSSTGRALVQKLSNGFPYQR
ncbi:MAG: A/G-specific adenine glycosylase [Thermoguttaceae bacterium]|nr:A/G-specific adenine glycosylase [Thermoguttaceae bacterium]